MEKNRYRYDKALLLGLLLLGIGTASCDKYDELPPLKKENVGNQYYKQPDPRGLTPEEQTSEKAIKDEYNKNTK